MVNLYVFFVYIYNRNGSVAVWHDAIIRLAKWYKDKGRGLVQARLLIEHAEWCLHEYHE